MTKRTRAIAKDFAESEEYMEAVNESMSAQEKVARWKEVEAMEISGLSLPEIAALERDLSLPVSKSEIDKLYEVASGNEADVLDRLRERAGIIWTCEGTEDNDHYWTVRAGETCDICGQSQPEATG